MSAAVAVTKQVAILKAEKLEKTYRIGKVDVPALRGVSFEVEAGEFVAIMGPSGCGKSTMLHLLGGLLTPTNGRIIIDGEDLTAASDAKRTDIRRRKIGFVFQRFNLFPTLTADGNLRLAERIHGNGSGDAERRREILSMLRLEDKMHHKPLELSGGEQQRVALARAVVTQPALVLADEPNGKLRCRPQHVSGTQPSFQSNDNHDHAQSRSSRSLQTHHPNARRPHRVVKDA
jgi:putative ABC transport system ATP-binding protein